MPLFKRFVIKEDTLTEGIIRIEVGTADVRVPKHITTSITTLPISHSVDNEVIEEDFFCHGVVKWDGCSHLYMYGEDVLSTEGELDSYYHVCGFHSYISHMRLMWLTYAASMEFYGNDEWKDETDKFKLNPFISSLKLTEEPWTSVDTDMWTKGQASIGKYNLRSTTNKEHEIKSKDSIVEGTN